MCVEYVRMNTIVLAANVDFLEMNALCVRDGDYLINGNVMFYVTNAGTNWHYVWGLMDILVWGKCGHVFHLHCITQWLLNEKGTCPMDRSQWVRIEFPT
jgi:hypothetical protein